MYIYVYRCKCMYICYMLIIFFIYIHVCVYVCIYIFLLKISLFVLNDVAADYLIGCDLQLFTLSGKEGNNFFPSFFMGELNL